MQINILTAAEENLMKLLWKLNSFYLKDIMEQHPEPKPHQNTVSTYLKILIEKNYLETQKEGRIFKYSVKIGYDDYKKFIINNILENHFNNDKTYFQNFLDDAKILEISKINSKESSEKVQSSSQNIVKKEPINLQQNPIAELIEELTLPKKIKKDKNSKDKKKDKKKKKK